MHIPLISNGQTTFITLENLREMVSSLESEDQRVLEIDWVNGTIRHLSAQKEHKKRLPSGARNVWRDIICEWS